MGGSDRTGALPCDLLGCKHLVQLHSHERVLQCNDNVLTEEVKEKYPLNTISTLYLRLFKLCLFCNSHYSKHYLQAKSIDIFVVNVLIECRIEINYCSREFIYDFVCRNMVLKELSILYFVRLSSDMPKYDSFCLENTARVEINCQRHFLVEEDF